MRNTLQLKKNEVYQGDCLELMKLIGDKSVDMILCDLPYGITACEWDKVLPLNELWKQYKRILKENGVVVLTASQPFTTDLINSNREWFRYCWVWDKDKGFGIFNSRFMPLKRHEDIVIFYKMAGRYFPIMKPAQKDRIRPLSSGNKKGCKNNIVGKENCISSENYDNTLRFPDSILKFSRPVGSSLHPTEKPVSLFRYLIKTYTNEGELVLDNCIGSGTTAVACKQANRNFIGIELSQEYVDIANKRLQQDNLHAFFQTQGVLTEPSPNRN